MQDKEINLVDYWQTIWDHRKLIIITVSIVTILAVIISLLLPKWYKATSVIMPPRTEQASLGSLSNSELSAFGIGGILGGSENQKRLLTILKSRRMLELLDKKFNFQKKYDTEFKFQAYDKIKSNLRIEVGDEEQISVSLLDKDQEVVAAMTNYIVHCLDSLNISLSTSKAKSNRKFIENRMKLVRDSLASYENRVAQFMEDNEIVSINKQLETEVVKAADMKATIMSKEVELDTKKSMLSTNNKEIQNLEIALHLLKEKYSEFFRPENSDQLSLNLENIPDIQKRYAQLKRKVVYFTKLLEYLGPQYEQAKIEEAKDVPTIQVIDRAKRPEWKSKPKRAKIIVITFIISFIISVYVAYFSGRKGRINI